MTHPHAISANAVRDWVGDFETGKGRPYAEGPAISGAVQSASELRAMVRGTRHRPYRVAVQLAGDGVASAKCSCPVGANGRCKHVAAVLLAYVEDSARFADIPDVQANLAARSPGELVALLQQLLRRAPELVPLLAAPLPGFAGAKPAPELYRRQGEDAIRAVNPHNDWAEVEIAQGLAELLQTAAEFIAVGDIAGNDAVVRGVAEALRGAELGRARVAAVVEALPEEYRAAITAHLEPEGPTAPAPF